jgi:hypothetical protein
MNDSPQSGQVWSDERWQLYIASLPPILRPRGVSAVPQWMLYHTGAFPRRFDTHFFFTTMPREQAAEHDRLETTEGVWIRPDEALSRFQEGRFPLVYATIRQLEALANLGTIASVERHFAAGPLPTVQPRVIEYRGQQVIVIQDPHA